MLLILKILAGISLIPFVPVGFTSLKIRSWIPPTHPLGVPWSMVALFKPDGSTEKASELIKKFKLYCNGLISATLMIILGFILPMITPPETFKDVNTHYYTTLGIGLVGGWLAFNSCIRYGNLVLWNILDVDPNKKK